MEFEQWEKVELEAERIDFSQDSCSKSIGSDNNMAEFVCSAKVSKNRFPSEKQAKKENKPEIKEN